MKLIKIKLVDETSKRLGPVQGLGWLWELGPGVEVILDYDGCIESVGPITYIGETPPESWEKVK